MASNSISATKLFGWSWASCFHLQLNLTWILCFWNSQSTSYFEAVQKSDCHHMLTDHRWAAVVLRESAGTSKLAAGYVMGGVSERGVVPSSNLNQDHIHSFAGCPVPLSLFGHASYVTGMSPRKPTGQVTYHR